MGARSLTYDSISDAAERILPSLQPSFGLRSSKGSVSSRSSWTRRRCTWRRLL